MQDRPLLAVAGPTGSGKSDLGLFLAARFGGEVVNYDSVQVYRGFDIGTAKLPETARRGIPHHLIDIAAPADVFTAGDYSRTGREVLAVVSARGHLPILVGGTGFYLRALLQGLFAGPGRDEQVRERLRQRAVRRPESLHRLLRRFDPDAARTIHTNDHQKLIRALEVCLQVRGPLSKLRQTGRDALTGYQVQMIGLMPPRAALYEHLNQRCVQMFAAGLVDEVRALLANGVPASAKPFTSLGYAQALAHLRGEISLEQAITDTQTRTRQYAKRQLTWFRREPGVHWLDGFGSDSVVQQRAAQVVEAKLLGRMTP